MAQEEQEKKAVNKVGFLTSDVALDPVGTVIVSSHPNVRN